MTELPAGDCQLKGQLFKLGLGDDPTCRCQNSNEMSVHTLCCHECLAGIRYHHFKSRLLNISDYILEGLSTVY
jgi:hypothetical protein